MKTASFFTYSGPGRISIALSAPKRITGYASFPALAPERAWFQITDKPRYTELYYARILAKLDSRQTWDKLHELANGAEPVLLCWEKPPFTDTNWCHRSIVAQWFKDNLGETVEEIPYEPRKRKAQPKQDFNLDLFNQVNKFI